jgi:hypothetical protein
VILTPDFYPRGGLQEVMPVTQNNASGTKALAAMRRRRFRIVELGSSRLVATYCGASGVTTGVVIIIVAIVGVMSAWLTLNVSISIVRHGLNSDAFVNISLLAIGVVPLAICIYGVVHYFIERRTTVELTVNTHGFKVLLTQGKQQYHHENKRDKQSFVFYSKNPFGYTPTFRISVHLGYDESGRSIDAKLIPTDDSEVFMDMVTRLASQLQMPTIPEWRKIQVDRKRVSASSVL